MVLQARCWGNKCFGFKAISIEVDTHRHRMAEKIKNAFDLLTDGAALLRKMPLLLQERKLLMQPVLSPLLAREAVGGQPPGSLPAVPNVLLDSRGKRKAWAKRS